MFHKIEIKEKEERSQKGNKNMSNAKECKGNKILR
jgi:hypothetical protein